MEVQGSVPSAHSGPDVLKIDSSKISISPPVLPELQESTDDVETSDPPLTDYDHSVITRNMVQFQVEYHFSNANLKMDNYLLSKLHEDKEHWVPVATVASLTKVRALTEDPAIVLEALRRAKTLQLSEDETMVRRPGFSPPKPRQEKHLRRTVFLYGLPPDTTREKIVRMCSEYGQVNGVILDETTRKLRGDGALKKGRFAALKPYDIEGVDPPERAVAEVVMTKKFGARVSVPTLTSPAMGVMTIDTNVGPSIAPLQSPSVTVTSPAYQHPIPNVNGNMQDFSHLRTAFVVFESQSQANKCVKSRLKSLDGVRAMHKYDFNKARKKVSAAQARGISPLFSPLNTSLPITAPNMGMSSPLFTFQLPSSVRHSFPRGNQTQPHRGRHFRRASDGVRLESERWSDLRPQRSSQYAYTSSHRGRRGRAEHGSRRFARPNTTGGAPRTHTQQRKRFNFGTRAEQAKAPNTRVARGPTKEGAKVWKRRNQ